MAIFGQVVTAMVTPFHQDYSVNYEEAANLAKYLVENGSDAIVVAGTTGESPTLTKEEKLRLFSVVVEAVGERAKVIAGTGSNSTAATIELTKEAEKTGVQGIMVVTPYYNKPPQAALEEHFFQVARATSLPIMLYNVPGRTGVNLLPATVAKLSRIDNIIALKDAAGNLDQTTETIRQVEEGFEVYSGDDSLTLPMLAVGAVGVVSVASHLVGREIKEMISAFIRGDWQEASAIHRKIFPVMKGLFCTTSPIPVKTALAIKGFAVGPLRPPLTEATTQEREFLTKLLKDYKLI